jgi:hypothetical protein
MHERQRPHEAQRFAGELVIPAQKRRHGRGIRPERAIPYGRLATAPANNLPDDRGAPEALVWDCGVLGDYKPILRRPKRADGSRGRLRMPETPPEGARLAIRRADLETEFAARIAVERALTWGVLESRGVNWRVSLTLTGAVRTIPDKGKPLKWASVEDLVQAVATGAI